MKIRKIIFVCAGALVCGTLTSFAVDDSSTNAMSQADRDVAQQDSNHQMNTFADAKHVIGMEIKDNQGQVLGVVKDFGVDLQNGRIVEVIIARGGILGLDEKLVGVPPKTLSFNDATNSLRFSGTSNELANAPEIKWSEWRDTTSPEKVRSLYQQYGERPYFGETGGASMNDRGMNEQYSAASAQANNQSRSHAQSYNNNNATGQNTAANTNGQDLAETTDTNNHGHASDNYPAAGGGQSAQGTSSQTPNLNTQANMTEENNRGHASEANATGNQTAANENWKSAGNHARYHMLVLGNVARATKVMGSETINFQNEKLGKVENLVIDLPRGRLVEVILASGGFLGIDAELSAVPPQALQYDSDKESLSLNTTKEALNAAPHFKAADWRQACDRDQIARVYSSYHEPDYFAVESSENGAQNVRYHENGQNSQNGLTPMDQGTSPADVDMTKQIRKALVADRTMSVNAHNVKVITINGRVTLRGKVNSDQEKSSVEDAATKIAGKDQVDDQLQVGDSSTATPMDSGTTNIQTPQR